MIIKIKGSIIVLLLMLAQTFSMHAQSNFPEGLKTAFKLGNSEQLANYFGNNIELMLLDKGDVYSKAQAQQIIQNFFTNNKPKTFIIENESFEQNTHFTIALLTTKTNRYRVFISYQNKKQKTIVNQLFIRESTNE